MADKLFVVQYDRHAAGLIFRFFQCKIIYPKCIATNATTGVYRLQIC